MTKNNSRRRSVRGVAALLMLALVPLALFPLALEAQEPAAVAEALAPFAPVYDVEDPDFVTPLDLEYRVVFDLSRASGDATAMNAGFATPARFVRMHTRAGVPLENLDVVIVVHGGAGKDLLENDEYAARYGSDNPNLELIAALQAVGVRVVLCGQTAAYRDLRRESLTPGVELALSAMTALSVLQAEGYALIGF